MTEYLIQRWDVLLINDKRVPAIYIKPDVDFMNFIKEHNYNVFANITGTDMDYDNKMIVGDLKKNSIQEIWLSEKMKIYRKILAERRYDAIDLCEHCYDTRSTQSQEK